jgi:2-iminobutanoate/2-iminopropanoate deaminase
MTPIQTPRAPSAVGPYSQAMLSQGFVFVSGQISIEPETNTLALFDGDIKKQTLQVLSNLLAILEAAGCTPSDVVKTTILLTDINDFSAVNALYADFFGDHKPARATYAVAALPKGANIEIEAIACCTSRPR